MDTEQAAHPQPLIQPCQGDEKPGIKKNLFRRTAALRSDGKKPPSSLRLPTKPPSGEPLKKIKIKTLKT
jgi:hypothetical protein